MRILDIIDSNLVEREPREKTHWYASDLGKCPASAYFARKGIAPSNPIDARARRIFAVGSLFEEWVFSQLKKAYPNAYQPETATIEEWDLRVRPDVVIPELQEVLELKTVHSKKFHWMEKKGEGADKHYLMQLYCEMKATGLNGRLVYVSKDDLMIAEYLLELDDPIAAEVEAEVKLLNDAWRKQEPPRPRCIGTWLEAYCPHAELCKKLHNEVYANK
jgi:hypothetical protein